MRAAYIHLLLLLVVTVSAQGVWAATGDEKPASAFADLNGKDLYKKVCKECHQAKAKAGEYTPMSLIQEQWQEFFDAKLLKTHRDLTLPAAEGADEARKLGGILDPQTIQKIRKFCVDHAADSEQPMTCG